MVLNPFQNILKQAGISESQIHIKEFDSESGAATLQIGSEEISVDHHYDLAERLNHEVSRITGNENPVFQAGQLHSPSFYIDRNLDLRPDGFLKFDSTSNQWKVKLFASTQIEDQEEIGSNFSKFLENWKRITGKYRQGNLNFKNLDADPRLKQWLDQVISVYDEFIENISDSQNKSLDQVKLMSFQLPTYMALNRVAQVFYEQALISDEIDLSLALKLYEPTEANFEARFPFIEAKPTPDHPLNGDFHPGYEFYVNGTRLPPSEYFLNIWSQFLTEAGLKTQVDFNPDKEHLGLFAMTRGGEEYLRVLCMAEGETPLTDNQGWINPDQVGSEQCGVKMKGSEFVKLNETSGFPELPRWETTRDSKGDIESVKYYFLDDRDPKSITIPISFQFDYKGLHPELVRKAMTVELVKRLYPVVRQMRNQDKVVIPTVIMSSSDRAYDLITEKLGEGNKFVHRSQIDSRQNGLFHATRNRDQSILWINTDIVFQYRRSNSNQTGEQGDLIPIIVREGLFSGLNQGVVERLNMISSAVLHESYHMIQDHRFDHYFLKNDKALEQILNLTYVIFDGNLDNFIHYQELLKSYYDLLPRFRETISRGYQATLTEEFKRLKEKLDKVIAQLTPYENRIKSFFPSTYAFQASFQFDENGEFIGFDTHEFEAEVVVGLRGRERNPMTLSNTLPDLVKQDICLSKHDLNNPEELCQVDQNDDQVSLSHSSDWSENPKWFFIMFRIKMLERRESSGSVSKEESEILKWNLLKDILENVNWNSQTISPKEIVKAIVDICSDISQNKRLMMFLEVEKLISKTVLQAYKAGVFREVLPLYRLIPKDDIQQGLLKFAQLMLNKKYDQALDFIHKVPPGLKVEATQFLLDLNRQGLLEDDQAISFVNKILEELDKEIKFEAQHNSSSSTTYELESNENLSFYERASSFSGRYVHSSKGSNYSQLVSRRIEEIERKKTQHVATLISNGKSTQAKVWFDEFEDNFKARKSINDLRVILYFKREQFISDFKKLINSYYDISKLRSDLLSINEFELVEQLDKFIMDKLNRNEFEYEYIKYLVDFKSTQEVEGWVKSVRDDVSLQNQHHKIAQHLLRSGAYREVKILIDFISRPGNEFGDLLTIALSGHEVDTERLRRLNNDQICWIIKVYEDIGYENMIEVIYDELSNLYTIEAEYNFMISQKKLPDWSFLLKD